MTENIGITPEKWSIVDDILLLHYSPKIREISLQVGILVQRKSARTKTSLQIPIGFVFEI